MTTIEDKHDVEICGLKVLVTRTIVEELDPFEYIQRVDELRTIKNQMKAEIKKPIDAIIKEIKNKKKLELKDAKDLLDTLKPFEADIKALKVKIGEDAMEQAKELSKDE